jgi:hypothetical protein
MGGTRSSHREDGKCIAYRLSVKEFKWKKQLVIIIIGRRILISER